MAFVIIASSKKIKISIRLLKKQKMDIKVRRKRKEKDQFYFFIDKNYSLSNQRIPELIVFTSSVKREQTNNTGLIIFTN